MKDLKPTTYHLVQSTKLSLKPNSGFTMIELLIYMGLLMALILVFTDIFTSIIDNQLRSSNTSNVADDGRFIYSRFIYDVGRANTIITPENAGSSSSTMVFTADGQTLTYSLNNGDLLITDASGSHAINSEGASISALLFTKVGTSSAKPTVRINFAVTGRITTSGVYDRQDFQTTAGLR